MEIVIPQVVIIPPHREEKQPQVVLIPPHREEKQSQVVIIPSRREESLVPHYMGKEHTQTEVLVGQYPMLKV
jgi:hypothetical protein